MSARSSWLPELPRAAWRLLAGESLSAVGCGLTLPFLLVYLHDVRGLDLAASGLAMSCLAAVGFLASPLGGALSDRAGARSALVTGLLVAAGGALALTAVREPWHALAATALLGMGAGLVLPAQQALLAGLAGESLSAAFSLRHLALNVGLGAGSTAGALLVDASAPGSFELVYMLQASAMAGFAAIVLSLPAPRAAAGAKGSVGRGTYRAVLGDRRLRRLLPLVTLLFAAGYSQYETAFPAYATGEGDIESSALGAAFAANTFTVVAAQLVALRAVRGWRRSHALALTGCVWAAAWGISLAAGALVGGTAAVVGFCLSMIVFGLGETLLAPTLGPLVNEWAPGELRGRYNGACAFACTGGYVLGPAVASVLLGAALGGVLIAGLMTVCALAALAALTLDVERPPRPTGLAGTRPVVA